ncbi:hypothetical protein Chor_008655 [Crotalus horridus]
MSIFHDEVEIEDFEYDEDTETYSYPCPCGDRFLITREDLENGEDVATCPSCSLIVKVIYDKVQERGIAHLGFLPISIPGNQEQSLKFVFSQSVKSLNSSAVISIVDESSCTIEI